VVSELCQTGVTVRVRSRRPYRTADLTAPEMEWAQGDSRRGTGRELALQHVDTALHTAHAPGHPATDLAVVERQIGYGRAAGRGRFVQVGIVEAAGVPGFGSYRAKAAEEGVAHSGLRFPVFRATQFHPLSASPHNGPVSEELAGPEILPPALTRLHLAARALTSESAARGQQAFTQWPAAHAHG
jgi:uncharacterized protein YbjT (DUF2867 family)